MNRRTFLTAASAVLAASNLSFADEKKRRVAVIGHTGRGNYGHGLDVVWSKIPECELVAVADGSAIGLPVELAKLGITNGYGDYRKMLEEVRPEFVTVAPRHLDQHFDMALAAIKTGVKGLYVEKPFCRSPKEADDLIAACEKHGARIAVAHRNRYHPALKHVSALIDSGELGQVLEFRGRGLGDQRGGGEDLWVLGCHIMNLIHHFGGKPINCSGEMWQDGRPMTRDDIKPGAEGLGPLAANEVHARYELENGVVAYYDSKANDGTAKRGYCLQIVGSKGSVFIHIDRDPVAHFVPGNPFDVPTSPVRWIPITTAGVDKPEDDPIATESVKNHVLGVRDLIAACDENRNPLCSVYDGAVTVEMICAVFASHREQGRAVSFPLENRGHALADWAKS
ncbi:MAG: Gfo/Idh/MocA family oxidoreductase [Planctomycetaceae bacterium]|nr:Gfo/Idh/MocA family oxidoreductase [Planctomycetaceae bacterium]MCB9950385.1 Gfo/Idh/MocA family oxidoreductase [Planctomycetaceae bacterium]